MVKELLFYSCAIVGTVLGLWLMSKVNRITKVSEKYCNQKYSYVVTIILTSGNSYCFQWYSDCLYKSVTDLLENASVRKGERLVFQYQEKEIAINKKEIVAMEMKSK